MDKIYISGLKVYAWHGVFPEEQERGQEFVLDITLSLPLERASRSDELSDTVSYADVTDTVLRVFTAKRYRLIERAAGAVADAVLESYPAVRGVTVVVRKPHAPVDASFSCMAVELTRTRGDA